MSKLSTDHIKTIAIIALTLLVVIGGSFLISELSGKSSAYQEGGNSNTTMNPTDDVSDIPEAEQKDPEVIGIDDYLRLKKGSELSIIYIARPTCHYCQLQSPILKNLIYLYDMKVHYLNTDELSEKDHQKLIDSDDYFSEGYGTPIILLVQDGKIVDKAEGLHYKEELETFFLDHNLIEKK